MKSKFRIDPYMGLGFLAGALVAVGLLVSCGGSSTPTQGATMGTVNTSLSDPPTCSSTISNVFVTVTKVTANLSADAGDSDSGWQTLVDLSSAPKQIDLLSLANTTCILSQLGSSTLPAGKYQQIRLYLLSNNPSSGTATPSSNACGGAGWNCVVPNGGSPKELQLSSESQTGIKIPSSQITSGGLTVTAGQATDLNINFDTCESLVHEGNGMWRLKPVLHAGEVSTNNNALSGTVIDSTTQKPIAGAVVSLEQPDASTGVDTISTGTTTDSSGNFSFCPLPAGATYDVVVTAMTPGLLPVTYDATVTLNVPVGSALGNIPLVPEPTSVTVSGTPTTTTSNPATILGQVTSTSAATTMGAASTDGTSANVTISTLQDAGNGKIVTIPPFTGMTAIATGTSATVNNGTSSMTCPTGTDCENFSVTVPASNPSVGTFAAGSTTTYSAPAGNPALYWVQAAATIPSGTNQGQADCTTPIMPATLTAGASPTGNQITVDPPPVSDSTATQNFDFSGCTAGF